MRSNWDDITSGAKSDQHQARRASAAPPTPDRWLSTAWRLTATATPVILQEVKIYRQSLTAAPRHHPGTLPAR